jgi:hypothetical protein
VLPDVAAADPFVDSASVPGRFGVETGWSGETDSATVAGAVAVTGAGAGTGAMTGAAQPTIVRFDDPELELPSRVSAEVHDDDAVATPSPLGIGTVSEDVLPGNDAVPCIVVVAPLVGLKTITHAGVFSPPLPLPDALKYDQSNVTDPQVAVAVTVCAAALAAKIASIAIASGMTRRERRTIAARITTLVAAGASLSMVMLALLSIGRVLGCDAAGGEMSARGD